MSKTTLEMQVELLKLLHAAYEDIIMGRVATASQREEVQKLSVSLAHRMAEDAKDAAAWRMLKDRMDLVVAEAEFKLGSVKGKMN